ncbi:MAG: depupylase/deamidase Dop, partial [Acidimicrobiia bacterium]
VLTNGARYYVDHAHPEMSTPECADARSITVFDRAGELILRRSMAAALEVLPPGEELVVYKDNSDGKGNSYGCHENYLMDRSTPFGQIVTHATAHFITRQLYTGSGKLGCEVPGVASGEIPFQLTQRADFFEEEVGLETTLKRPIINTRDEPHADAQKYRRLHVICGDANMSEVATFVKVGVTAIVLAMVEDGYLEREFVFENPVQTMRQVSYDLTLRQPHRLADGSSVTALEVQWEFLNRAHAYRDAGGLEAVGEQVGLEVLERWESILDGLENDPVRLSDQLDWVAKKRLLDAYRERGGLEWNDPKLAALALQYHDLRPAKSVFPKVGMQTIVSDAEAEAAVSDPPIDTRAYFRGTCLSRWADSIVAANWDSLVFDIGNEPLRRVPMMEPGRGTKSHVDDLFEACDGPQDLLAALESGG